MSIFERIIGRRAFLGMGGQLSLIIAGLQIQSVVLTGDLKAAPCPDLVYGCGKYGDGHYGD